MKIRLIMDPPVEEKHGLTKGRVFEVVKLGHGTAYWFVMGDTGEEVGVLRQEAELVIEEEKSE